MLDAFGGRSAEKRRGPGLKRALALVTFAALLLAACSPSDTVDPAGESFDVAFEADGGEPQTGTLEGATVNGTIKIVVRAGRHAKSASFYLDDPRMRGEPYVVDQRSPFTAEISTAELEPGQHTVTVAVDYERSRRTSVKTVRFTVAALPAPTEPSDPAPTEPTDPSDPAPTEPADPGDPSEPTDPGTPTDPNDPDEPTQPEEPAPSEPTPPTTPDYPAPTYWVSTTGSDSNDGRSADRPFRTIAKAASVVRPGDVIYIRGGTYREYLRTDVWKTSGQPGKPITIMGAPGETVILDGSDRKNGGTNPSSPQLIWLRDTHWYVFQNLILRNAGGRGMELEGDHHVVRNVISHGHHGDGIYIEGSYNLVEDVVSYDNYSYNNGGDSADGVKVDRGTGNVLRRVVVYDNSDDGIDLWLSTDTLVEYSVAYRNGRGTSGNGMGFKMSANIADSRNVIRYNVAFSNRSFNFTDNEGGGLLIYNNTSFDSGSRGFVVRGRSGKAASKVYNNISFNEKAPLIDVQSGSTKPIQAANSWNLGITDPGFASTDPGSANFLRLRSGSKAIDAGTDLGQQYVGRAPDLGAYEYGMPSIVAGAEEHASRWTGLF